jgi:hypothetical protein
MMLGVMVFLILVGVGVIVAYYSVRGNGGGTVGVSPRPTKPDLAFKPFTLNDLLHNKTTVDLAKSGTRIHSAKFVQIEQRTSKLRGLPLKKQIPLVACSESVILYQLLSESSDKESVKQTAADQKLLVALGLFKPGQNLEEIIVKVLTEQIAGSYDTTTKEITIVSGKGLGTAMDEITMSHEVTHGLQDQNFGLDKPPLDNPDYNGDEDSAVESLIEGDATTTMYSYAQTYLTVTQLMQMQTESENVSSVELDRAPLYLQRSLLFPYEDGLTFVEALQKSDGENQVDNAFRKPPLATRQIMHPEVFLAGKGNPRPVPLPDLTSALGKGWSRINDDAMGEFDLEVWFEQFAGKTTATEASEGWAGNTIQYYQGPGTNYTMPNMTTWDTALDAQEFFDDYVKLLQGRFKGSLKKLGSTSTSYVYQANGQFYYCGISGDSTLALQATSRDTLDTALKSWQQMAPVP